MFIYNYFYAYYFKNSSFLSVFTIYPACHLSDRMKGIPPFLPAPQHHPVLPPPWWRHHHHIRNPTNLTWRTILPLILHFTHNTHNTSWIISSHTSATTLLPNHWCLLITCIYRILHQGTKWWLSNDVIRGNCEWHHDTDKCIFVYNMNGLCQCAIYNIECM